MNPQVTDYINNAPAEQKQIMEALRQLIHESVADVKEEFKWSRPVFRAGKDFTYFKTAKAYLTLGFFDFVKLNDKQNKLQGTGKDMRHIKLKKISDIDREELQEWFKTVAV
ncbi:DUF1801 domain-containing protein [Pontibacter qinzhouensis]|uniref:DUF1801 domain-containing protein n=1 Tax=Pontibacter qinzhouensis TaxID=2603253 RepID=A0A5C8J748_9BACT|nr:DUF1801 domain-containing protein [Pontibacter qinzhouensis]TXK32797.1 DUF1801 domain-containing protein [Pontibacter qinzhouensis]